MRPGLSRGYYRVLDEAPRLNHQEGFTARINTGTNRPRSRSVAPTPVARSVAPTSVARTSVTPTSVAPHPPPCQLPYPQAEAEVGASVAVLSAAVAISAMVSLQNTVIPSLLADMHFVILQYQSEIRISHGKTEPQSVVSSRIRPTILGNRTNLPVAQAKGVNDKSGGSGRVRR